MKSDAKRVKAWIVQGLSHSQIAKKLGISQIDLQEVYAHELLVARPEARAAVGGHLFKAAVRGHMASICFFLKTRAGWSETRYREPNKLQEAEVDAGPPKERLPTIRLPCNTRGGCFKAGPKQTLTAFKAIHAELIAEANRRNMPLDFQRPQNVQVRRVFGLYCWPHGKKEDAES
jgi:hypothetical protein